METTPYNGLPMHEISERILSKTGVFKITVE